MATTWTLKYDGTEQTFAAWGLSNSVRTRRSQDTDLFTFTAPGADIDGAALFPYAAIIEVFRNVDGTPTRWFYGRIETIPREGSPHSEDIHYVAVGPWYWLSRVIYQQSWKIWDDGEGSLIDRNKSRVILGQNSLGARITTGEQIEAAVQYAIDNASAPITIGAIDPDITPPLDECMSITCAEAVLKMLRWHPDVVTWFDYTTATPTLHVRPRSNLSAASYSVDDGDPALQLNIRARTDIQIPAVVLLYEQTHTLEDDGADPQTYEEITEDKYPSGATGNELGALVLTIELAGARISRQRQKIVTEDFPEDLNSKTWWKAKLPHLANIDDDDITITDGAKDSDFDRELIEGTVQDWMILKEQEEASITALATYTLKDPQGNPVETVTDEPISYNCQATNCRTKTYVCPSIEQYAEEVPSGTARKIYDAANPLQYQGAFVLSEAECSGAVHPGLVLNLTDGLAAWATMNALIQQVAEDIQNAVTTIEFGPSGFLSAVDLITLIRANRRRRPPERHVVQTSGKSDDTGDAVEHRGQTPLSVRSARPGPKTKLQLRNYTEAETPALKTTIELDPSAVDPSTDAEKVLVLKTDGDALKTEFDYVRAYNG